MAKETEQPFISRTSAITSTVAGLLHAGVSVFFWNHFYETIGEILSYNLLLGAYLLIGMFSLGFIPVAYSTTQKSISPVLLVSVSLIVSVYTEWQAQRSPAFGGPGFFGMYIIFWVGVVLLAGLAGDIEVKLKQRTTA